MTRRYKGRPSGKTIARDFPFVVEIAVPPDGLGRRLNAMHAFHNQRGLQAARIRLDTKMIAISCCGVLPAVQSRKSLPLNSVAP
jgi:hypothetical protein